MASDSYDGLSSQNVSETSLATLVDEQQQEKQTEKSVEVDRPEELTVNEVIDCSTDKQMEVDNSIIKNTDNDDYIVINQEVSTVRQ